MRFMGWALMAFLLALLICVGTVLALGPAQALNRLTRWQLSLLGQTGQADLNQPYGPGPRQRADVYWPPTALGRPTAGWPVAVFFYGGSWRSGSKADYEFVGRSLAARGMLVVVADYRLYPDVQYKGLLEDSARATAWVFKQLPTWQADSTRVFVIGHSAGAYNAAMLSLDPHWLSAWGHAPGELAGFIGLAGPYNFLPITVDEVKPVFGYPDTPAQSQPMAHVSRLAPPTWLATVTSDDVVNPDTNTGALAQGLAKVGAPVSTRSYEHLTHVSLVASVARPLQWMSPLADDLASLVVRGTAPPTWRSPASAQTTRREGSMTSPPSCRDPSS
jgi:acetyl esterase/lipase